MTYFSTFDHQQRLPVAGDAGPDPINSRTEYGYINISLAGLRDYPGCTGSQFGNLLAILILNRIMAGGMEQIIVPDAAL